MVEEHIPLMEKIKGELAKQRDVEAKKRKRAHKRPKVRKTQYERPLDKLRPPAICTKFEFNENQHCYKVAMHAVKKAKIAYTRQENELVYNLRQILCRGNNNSSDVELGNEQEKANARRGPGGIYFPDTLEYKRRS